MSSNTDFSILLNMSIKKLGILSDFKQIVLVYSQQADRIILKEKINVRIIKFL